MDTRKSTMNRGRPRMEQGARTKIVQARVTEEEFASLRKQAADLGITVTELLRNRLLDSRAPRTINTKELLRQLDEIGTELGRTGNNINQLARHANTLAKLGGSPKATMTAFVPLFQGYISHQDTLEKLIRHLLRKMAR